MEKYCLSIPCQELVCVVAFFWASVALALWPQPPTPLSQINSTIGGLGRKLTRTTAKQKGVLKYVCLCMCVYVRLSSGSADFIFFLVSAICLFVGDSQTSLKKKRRKKRKVVVVLPQQVCLSEQSPFF